MIALWDRLVYKFTWRSIQRMCQRHRGMAYLMKLWIDEFLKNNPPDDRTMALTESYFRGMLRAQKDIELIRSRLKEEIVD